MRSLAHTNASGRADYQPGDRSRSAGSSRHVCAVRRVRSRMETASRNPAARASTDDAAPGSPRRSRAASLREQVGRDERAGAAIVERDEVVVSARRIWLDRPIEQHQRNPRVSQRFRDMPIDGEPGGACSSGAKNTPSTRRATYCAQSWRASISWPSHPSAIAPQIRPCGVASDGIHQSTRESREDLDLAEIGHQHAKRQRLRGNVAARGQTKLPEPARRSIRPASCSSRRARATVIREALNC